MLNHFQAAILIAVALVLGALESAAQPARRGILVGPVVESYIVSADDVEGAMPGAGVGIAIPVNALLDFEAELVRPIGVVRREYSGYGYSFAPQGSTSLEEFERYGVFLRYTNERRIDSVLSFGATFHPRVSSSRFQPRLFAGVTTHFASERHLLEPLHWSPLLTAEQRRQIRTEDNRSRRALGSLTLGVSLAYAMTSHLVVMPDLRYDYGSIGDEINNTGRLGVRVLYRF